MKAIKLLAFLLSLLFIAACSNDPVIEETPPENTVAKTVWIRPLTYESGTVYQYEVFEFPTNEDFALWIMDTNGIKRVYILLGKYKQVNNTIYCTYKKDTYSPTHFPESKASFSISDEGYTLVLDSNVDISIKGKYVKQ